MRVTVIATVTASNLEEAQAKLDATGVSRAVRPHVDRVEGVSLQWHGTRFDEVEQCTGEQALRKAWLDDLCEIIGGEADELEEDEDPTLQ